MSQVIYHDYRFWLSGRGGDNQKVYYQHFEADEPGPTDYVQLATPIYELFMTSDGPLLDAADGLYLIQGYGPESSDGTGDRTWVIRQLHRRW